MGKKSAKNVQRRIAELEVKRRSGLVRMVGAIIACVVVIVAKVNLTAAGVEWANSTLANGAIFVIALVLAGVAGYGSRAWWRARGQIQQLQGDLRR